MTAVAGIDGRSRRARGRDFAIAAGSATGLLAWDASGADLRVSRLFGDALGFGARESWWAATLLHSGGRWAAWLALAFLLAVLLRAPRPAGGGPTRADRARWLAVSVLCILLVSGLKRLSATSCPWDLAEFGGSALHVSHWRFGQADGGPGHCFPAGHASAAFAFFAMHFLWRDHDPRLARWWLVGAMAVGTLFGAAQVARGAHHVSHTLWTAWICWLVCSVAGAAWGGRARGRRRRCSRAGPP